MTPSPLRLTPSPTAKRARNQPDTPTKPQKSSVAAFMQILKPKLEANLEAEKPNFKGRGKALFDFGSIDQQ